MKKVTLLQTFISFFGIAILLLFSFSTKAQLNINNTMTPNQLVQNVLVGGGVTITNVVMTSGTASMYGDFTNGNTTNLGLDAGVILSTGTVTDIDNAVNFFQSTDMGQGSDADLDMLTSAGTHDACVLEFDFKPLADTVRFRYVFGSEEYPEYTCSQFNDVFGFFLSGPGITGTFSNNAINIALIPGTTLPVAINTVNQGNIDLSYPSGNCTSLDYDTCFVYNQALGGTTVCYDGFTEVFTAFAVVTPCQTYHIKLAIADVGDGIYDSGVFLEANSFSTNGVSNNTSYTSSIDTLAVEGCNNAIVHFYLNTPAADTTVIHFNITGTAQNGIDYPAIPDSIVFLPGQDSTAVWIIPFNDGLVEPIESVFLVYNNASCGGGLDSIPVYIKDYTPIQGHDATYASCSGQSVLLDLGISGGFSPLTYNWSAGGSTPTITVTPASTTFYALTTTDACGGNRVDSAFVFVSGLTSNITTIDSVSCKGLADGSATVVPANGLLPYIYAWSPSGGSGPTATNLAAGTYYVTVTDSVGCFSVDTVVILEPTLLTAAISNVDSVTCYGQNSGTATVNPGGGTPGYTYLWNTSPAQASASATGLAGGVYIVTVTDHNGCTATASATVFEPTALNANITNITDADCFGNNTGSATVTVNGGTPTYTYLWNTSPAQSTNVASGLTAGTYTVTVTDDNGCTTAQTANISQPSQMIVNVANVDSVLCFGQSTGSVTANVAGGTPNYTYAWNTSPVQNTLIAINVPIGTYTITVTDNNGCTGTASGTVLQPSLLTASITNVDSVVCFGQNNGSATVTAGGGIPNYTYAWSTSPTQTTATATNMPAGLYTVTVSDDNGCTQTLTAVVSQPPDLILGLTPTDMSCSNTDPCNGQVTTSLGGGISPYTYSWTGGETTPTITGLCPGSYYLTVTDANGCTEVNNSSVGTSTVIDAIFTATPDEGIIPLPVLFSFTGSGASSYAWIFGDGNSSTLSNPTNTYTTAGTYTVTLIINSGAPDFCQDTFQLIVTVENPSIVDQHNVFTPNGDGKNDVFMFETEGIETFYCMIFNRWGKKIYEWSDVTQGWDGTTKGGAEASDGVYYYIIEAKGFDDVVWNDHGTVTLLRK
jgi:gliding motility-associated-like protein